VFAFFFSRAASCRPRLQPATAARVWPTRAFRNLRSRACPAPRQAQAFTPSASPTATAAKKQPQRHQQAYTPSLKPKTATPTGRRPQPCRAVPGSAAAKAPPLAQRKQRPNRRGAAPMNGTRQPQTIPQGRDPHNRIPYLKPQEPPPLRGDGRNPAEQSPEA